MIFYSRLLSQRLRDAGPGHEHAERDLATHIVMLRVDEGEKCHELYSYSRGHDGEIDLQNVPRTDEWNTRFTPQCSNQCLLL